MKTMLFKTLMYGNTIVDTNLLDKGIYGAIRPPMFDNTETMQTLVDRLSMMKDYTGKVFFSDEYFSNLGLCQLVDMEITIKN